MNNGESVKIIDVVAEDEYKKALAEHKTKVARGEAEAKHEPKRPRTEFEFDGWLRNTTHLVVNEAKATPSKEDIKKFLEGVCKAGEFLKAPGKFRTEPAHVKELVSGLTDVVPVLSGYTFTPDVQAAVLAARICVVRTDGVGYMVDPRSTRVPTGAPAWFRCVLRSVGRWWKGNGGDEASPQRSVG